MRWRWVIMRLWQMCEVARGSPSDIKLLPKVTVLPDSQILSQLHQPRYPCCKPLPQEHWNSSGLVPAISEKSEILRSDVRILLLHFVCYGLGVGDGGVHVFLLCIWFWCWCAVLGPPLRCPKTVGCKRTASTLCSGMLRMQENVGSPSWKGTCNSSRSVRGGLAEEQGACVTSARAL